MQTVHRPTRDVACLTLSVCWALFSHSAATAQVTPTFNDVPYATVLRDDGGVMTLMMDIYRPNSSGPVPCVIWIHGGAWLAGSFQAMPDSAPALLQRGIAVASVQYRFSYEAIFPAQIHDVKGAIRFLRANAATFSLDPTRFATWGPSAGGHLAALAATSGDVAALEGTTGGNLGYSSRVQVAVDHFGPTDILVMNLDVTVPPGSIIDHDAPNSPESHLVGWDAPGQGIGDIRENLFNPQAPYPALVLLCFQVSPVTWASFDDPPMFIAHGTNDTLVPLFQSTRLAIATDQVGVWRDYREVQGAGHGFLGGAITTATLDFLEDRLSAVMPMAGDHNGDGDVDLFDFAGFEQCRTGPGPAALSPICARFDLDADLDVDTVDFGEFQRAFTGPG